MNYATINNLSLAEIRAALHVSTEDFNARYRPWLCRDDSSIADSGRTAQDAGAGASAFKAHSADASSVDVGAAQA